MNNYEASIVTMHDDEVKEIKNICGLDIICRNGSQLHTLFKLQLTDEQANNLRTHPACYRLTLIE